MADTFSLAERNQAQIREALSSTNVWYTGEVLGRSPNPREAVEHYGHHGGPENFARREQEGKITKPKAG